MFEDRALSKLEEEAEGWKKIHNEEFHGFLRSPNIVMVINLGSYMYNLEML